MRFAVLPCALLLGAALQAPSGAERFAVACTGRSTHEHTLTGRRISGTDALPRQVYVVDPTARTVQRALMPRQEFENLCAGYSDCTVDISPGQILLTGSEDSPGGMASRVSLLLDRQSGRGEHVLDLDFPDGRYDHTRWEMTCARAEIPVFDTSRNRF